MTQMRTQSLKKHVGAVHVCGKLSLLKRKIANVLLLNAYDELTQVDEHSISIRDLAATAGFNSKDVELLKEAFRDLAKTTVEWNILSEDGNEDWTVSTLLSRATIRKGRGVCLYAYDRELSKKLYHPDMYARINLTIQRKFRSSYALVLYENCARFRGVKTTGWISVADWRRLFGIEPGEYKEFKDFSKRVLKPAIAEVNRASDLAVAADYRRESRRVSGIRFSITEQSLVDQEALEQPGGRDVSTMLERLIRAGVSRSIAGKLLLEHDEPCILRNLDYVEKAIRDGKRITNVGGYTVKAIQGDFGLADVESKDRNSREQAKAHRLAREKAVSENLQAQETREATARVESRFDALSTTEQQAFIDQTISDLGDNAVMLREYRKRGLKSAIFYRAVLHSFRQTLDESEQETVST